MIQWQKIYPTPAMNVSAMRGAAAASNHCSEDNGAANESAKDQLNMQPTPVSLPVSSDQLSKPARALLMRLLEKDPKVRLRNLRQLQQIAFYLGFNFEHVKAKKMSPRCILEQYISNSAVSFNNANKDIFLDFGQKTVAL